MVEDRWRDGLSETRKRSPPPPPILILHPKTLEQLEVLLGLEDKFVMEGSSINEAVQKKRKTTEGRLDCRNRKTTSVEQECLQCLLLLEWTANRICHMKLGQLNKISDELPFSSNKMQDEFSTVDGFLEITESLAEMIKYVANEPSVGLFYIQQHTQNAVPNVINIKNKVGLKSHEATLHTEDSEDSIVMVKSMKDCGLPIADDMIADIKKSLSIMSAKQPKKGLISSPISSFKMGRSSSLGPTSWGWGSPEDSERKDGYFSSVFKSAKQKAGNFKWVPLDPKDPVRMKDEGENSVSYSSETLSSSGSTLPGGESDELPLSSQVTDELPEDEGEEGTTEGPVEGVPPLPIPEEYESFKANREAKLEEWLEGNGKRDVCDEASA